MKHEADKRGGKSFEHDGFLTGGRYSRIGRASANATMYLLIAGALSFLSISCSSSSFVGMQSLKSQLHLAAFPGARQFPDADAVVLSDVHHVYMSYDPDYGFQTDVKVTKVIKLLRNVDDLASVELNVYSGDAISDLSARTIQPDGSSMVLSKSDFHMIKGAGSDYIFYSDQEKIRFTFPAVSKNCIIEYHYTLHESHPFIEDVWEIQEMYPVLRNVYELTMPERFLISPQDGGFGWNWRYRAYNCNPGDPFFRKDPGNDPDYTTVTLGWTRTDIPAFKPDPMMPPYINFIQYVKFSPSDWKTWNDISGWYYKFLFRPQLDITPAISEKAEELVRGCRSETEKIEKVFDFVQTLRYAAIELGQGGYVPSKPGTVLKRMYGDCKDKSILLIGLLRTLGITAKPVLVLTSDEGTVDPGFPSWEFNHMIVKVKAEDGKSYWLDPTVENCALGEIPYQDSGTNALVLNEDNTSEIERIPETAFTQNAENIMESVKIKADGSGQFNIGMRFTGQENLETRAYTSDLSSDQLARFCKSLLSRDYLDAAVDSCALRNKANFDKPLRLGFSMTSSGAMRKDGGYTMLSADPIDIGEDWSWLSRDHRKYEISFDYPRLTTKLVDIALPPGYEVDKLPKAVEYRAPGLYFSERYIVPDKHRLQVNEEFAISSRLIPPDDYAKVKHFVEKVDERIGRMIVIRKSQTP